MSYTLGMFKRVHYETIRILYIIVTTRRPKILTFNIYELAEL